MKVRVLLGLVTAATVAMFVSASGCADGRGTIGFQNDDAGTDEGGDDGQVSFGDGANADTTPSQGCSGDLRHVIDQDGNNVKDCPPDQGCLNGTCIKACDAAGGSHGNIGCDFLLATPAFHPGMEPPCFAAFVTNEWPEDAKISVTYQGAPYDLSTFGRLPNGGSDPTAWPTVPSTGIPPGKVAVLFLADVGSFSCPISPAVQGNTAVWTGQYDATGRGHAFHISSDYPVTTYDILPYGGARSFLPGAQLVMPTTAWGTNYISVIPERGKLINWGPQFMQAVATESGTTVTIFPTQPLAGGTGVLPAAANAATKYTLEAGEFIQWQDTHEATGSILQSDKPIALVTGNDYFCLASKTSPMGGGCDSAHQMIPPVSALGSEYVAAPFVTRRKDLADESILYRIVGVVNDTKLNFDPPVGGTPASINLADVVNFETTGSFRVSSQDSDHPFFIVQEMPGCPNTNSRPGYQTLPNTCDQCLGDEDFVNMLPPAQFLSSYVFFTDPTYWTTNLALVRVKDAKGFHDVNVDCLGAVTGWQDVGTSGEYQVATAELVRGNVGVGTCTNGVHSATSDGRFGVTVWGEDCASSYGYPAGGNAAVINKVVVPPAPH